MHPIRQPKNGAFLNLLSPYGAEILALAGFDWLLLDAEHAEPSRELALSLLRQFEGTSTQLFVRVPSGKGEFGRYQLGAYLDLGYQNLVIPMIGDKAEAQQALDALQYRLSQGGSGSRGVAASRSAKWGAVANPHARSNQELQIFMQIESLAAMEQLADILSLERLDGIFIGPGDLAADLGHIGQLFHPQVQSLTCAALAQARAAGKQAMTMAIHADAWQLYSAAGADFLASTSEAQLLGSAAKNHLQALLQA